MCWYVFAYVHARVVCLGECGHLYVRVNVQSMQEN